MVAFLTILFIALIGYFLYVAISVFSNNQLISNITGGFIAAVIFAVLVWLREKIQSNLENFYFRGIFGKDSNRRFYITYSRLGLRKDLFVKNTETGKEEMIYDKDGRLKIYPYFKPDDPQKGQVRVYSVTPFVETKAAKYISEIFGKIVKLAPNFAPDYEVQGKQDISFCSIGGLTNYKTRELIGCEENKFFCFGSDSAIIRQSLTEKEKGEFIIVGKDREREKFCIEGNNNEFDHGLILKIRSTKYPKKAWIVVAGIGEPGTSGAAWYLANRWKDMPQGKSFAIIVKVKNGIDELAEEVVRIRYKNFLESLVSNLKNF